ncbi:MAG: hybrid sensor histidine kinase/response regulator, partial [Vibrio toranzoniae]
MINMSIRWRLIFLSTVSVFIMFGFAVNELLKSDKTVAHLEATRMRVEALQSFNAISGDAYQWIVLSNDIPEKGQLLEKLNTELDLLAENEKQLQRFDTNWSAEPQLIELKSALGNLVGVGSKQSDEERLLLTER